MTQHRLAEGNRRATVIADCVTQGQVAQGESGHGCIDIEQTINAATADFNACTGAVDLQVLVNRQRAVISQRNGVVITALQVGSKADLIAAHRIGDNLRQRSISAVCAMGHLPDRVRANSDDKTARCGCRFNRYRTRLVGGDGDAARAMHSQLVAIDAGRTTVNAVVDRQAGITAGSQGQRQCTAKEQLVINRRERHDLLDTTDSQYLLDISGGVEIIIAGLAGGNRDAADRMNGQGVAGNTGHRGIRADVTHRQVRAGRRRQGERRIVKAHVCQRVEGNALGAFVDGQCLHHRRGRVVVSVATLAGSDIGAAGSMYCDSVANDGCDCGIAAGVADGQAAVAVGTESKIRITDRGVGQRSEADSLICLADH